MSTVNHAVDVQAKYRPIERVIQEMHARLEEPFTLRSMAEIAFISRFHFNRTFRRVTGIPPTQFLYAIRIATARRLLLKTQMNVIDICYEVGYNSLGTFTRRFTELLGLSPTRLRSLARSCKNSPIREVSTIQDPICPMPVCCLSGRISAPSDFRGLILIGLFDTAIPQGKPAACTILAEPGPYRIMNAPAGKYHLFALALEHCADLNTVFDCESALRCGGQQISISGSAVERLTDLHLRPAAVTDPPILLTVPLLLNELLQKCTYSGL